MVSLQIPSRKGFCERATKSRKEGHLTNYLIAPSGPGWDSRVFFGSTKRVTSNRVSEPLPFWHLQKWRLFQATSPFDWGRGIPSPCFFPCRRGLLFFFLGGGTLRLFVLLSLRICPPPPAGCGAPLPRSGAQLSSEALGQVPERGAEEPPGLRGARVAGAS